MDVIFDAESDGGEKLMKLRLIKESQTQILKRNVALHRGSVFSAAPSPKKYNDKEQQQDGNDSSNGSTNSGCRRCGSRS